MGMAAMLVMNMAVAIIVVMVIMSMMVAVVMVMTVVMVVMHRRQPRLRARGAPRAHGTPPLGPDQRGAKQGDQAVAGDLDRLLRPAHGLRGGIEQPGADADQHDGDEGLQQPRDERQH